jgi:hypothetical protein
MTAGNDGPSCGVPHYFFIQTLWVRILKRTYSYTFCIVFKDVFIHDIIKMVSMREMEENLKRRIRG